MAKITRFEDLQSWQKAWQLTNSVYDLIECSRLGSDYSLRNQIQRAAASVIHNIAEGFDAGTNPEFMRFLRMARRSASEVQSELYFALDRKYIEPLEWTQTYDLATETKRLINGMIGYLRRSPRAAKSSKKP